MGEEGRSCFLALPLVELPWSYSRHLLSHFWAVSLHSSGHTVSGVVVMLVCVTMCRGAYLTVWRHAKLASHPCDALAVHAGFLARYTWCNIRSARME
jgi:hypothetical protein